MLYNEKMGELQKMFGGFRPHNIDPIIRIAHRTKVTAPTVLPGEIVLIAHPDLDSVAAEGLVRAKPSAIINCAPFVTGKYPNQGPKVLLSAGIPIYESDANILDSIPDRSSGRFEASYLVVGGVGSFALRSVSEVDINVALASARENLDSELDAFVRNTLTYLERDSERTLLLDPIVPPDVKTDFFDKPVVVAVRGNRYREDLRLLANFFADAKPLIIAVDGAADELLSIGLVPDVILGDMDSVSDRSLRCGAELIVHAYASSSQPVAAPGASRCQQLGLPFMTFPVAGTSEDAALLLAYELGAKLIVAVGTHTHMEDFLDKGRRGMASTFLVRLKVGSRLVDAKGVSSLMSMSQPIGPSLLLLVSAALFPVIVLLLLTPAGQILSRSLLLVYKAFTA
ncbi:MAG: putative cytokinetic ring protein SteA [Armatimonadaceae bacterium]